MVSDSEKNSSRRRRVWEWLPLGWRRAATVNVGLLSMSLLLLLGVLATAVSATGEINQIWMFYTADCRSSSVTATNTGLHLLLNAVSTVILASSNFFMQVLNAPSRKEVDDSHAKGDWLDIGIPSWRNGFRLSRFKMISWLVLFLTSLPIHMVFNSSVFLVNSLMGDYHVTVAAESFTADPSVFFLPGASLWTSDVTGKTWGDDFYNRPDVDPWYNNPGLGGYPPKFQDYVTNNYSTLFSNVSKAAVHAVDWERLEPSECRKIYAPGLCSGLRNHRNLLLVIKGQGWKRSELWSLDSDDIWEPVVPRDELNTLWFSTQCQMTGSLRDARTDCGGNCDSIIPHIELEGRWLINMTKWYDAAFSGVSHRPTWNESLYSAPNDNSWLGLRYDSPYFNTVNGSLFLEISHCRAEPRGATCAVALSKPLLLAVILSVFLKVVTCIIVIRVLGAEESLVTPGDAISSFISVPERRTYDSGPVTQNYIRKRRTPRENESSDAYRPPLTVQWVNQRHQKGSAVPRVAWIWTLSILTFGIVASGICLAVQLGHGIPLQWVKLNAGEASSTLRAVASGTSFISSVLTANIPQLYLSFWYLAYNSLMTRLEMSYEWSLFSVEYRPLRVTHPRGQQISTYRLQLPYSYSIPLILISTLLHWLLSASLFIIVSRGTYHDLAGVWWGYVTDAISLPNDATVAIGTSSLPVMILTIIGSIMVLVPIAIARKELPGDMPVVGSNSRAMLAASRVSPTAKIPRTSGDESDGAVGIELQELIPASNKGSRESVNSDAHQNMAFRLLKWGEVEMPEDWCRELVEVGNSEEAQRVRHLSFGTVLDDPQPPTEGYWYA